MLRGREGSWRYWPQVPRAGPQSQGWFGTLTAEIAEQRSAALGFHSQEQWHIFGSTAEDTVWIHFLFFSFGCYRNKYDLQMELSPVTCQRNRDQEWAGEGRGPVKPHSRERWEKDWRAENKRMWAVLAMKSLGILPWKQNWVVHSGMRNAVNDKQNSH